MSEPTDAADTYLSFADFSVWLGVRLDANLWQLHHGRYKTQPNTVEQSDGTRHWCAPVDDVGPELQRVVDETRRPEFQSAHPAPQAAYAHHAFVAIHPFEDGNGRTARALASVFLYRAVGVPLLVMSDQQPAYWKALGRADRGDIQPFVRFIEDRALDTMSTVRLQLEGRLTAIDSPARRLKTQLTSPDGRSGTELSAIAQRLKEVIHNCIDAQWNPGGNLACLGPDVERSFEATTVSGSFEFRGTTYQIAPAGLLWRFDVHQQTYRTSATMRPIVGVSMEPGTHYAVIVKDATRESFQPLALRVNDLDPEIGFTAYLQIDGWVRSLLNVVLDELTLERSSP